jgi:surface carbohydrate biosynthesis protein
MRAPVLIPCETRSRELDAKLLLACAAAERGFPCLLGSRAELHLMAGRLPRGIYLAKDVTAASRRIFDILSRLGHRIAAWDEEGLVRSTSDHYQRTRLSREALARVSHLFAWGEADAALLARSEGARGIPVHATGNPRIDLLRRELRGFFADEVAGIERRFGRPLLLNTNFAHLNHFVPRLSSYGPLARGRARRRADPTTARLARYRQELFARFLELVPALARAFPGERIAIRPHPDENAAPWREAARGFANVEVVREGGSLPWLLASRVLVHNGCTTAIEATLLGRPAVAFAPLRSAEFDRELPDSLSHEAKDPERLVLLLRAALSGELAPRADPRRAEILRRHLASLAGRLACDRIVDVLEGVDAARPWPEPGLAARLHGRAHAELRAALLRGIKAHVPGHKNSAAYQRHRFPPLSLGELRERIDRFQKVTGRFSGLACAELSKNVFELVPASPEASRA